MIYIITINYNNSKDTIACMESLKEVNHEFRLIVVDNGSSTDDVYRLEQFVIHQYSGLLLTKECEDFQFTHQHRVALIKEPNNLGFTGGNNIAIRLALKQQDIEGVLLLNNDTVVAPNFLTELTQFKQKTPNAAIIGGRIFLFEPSDVIWYDGGQFSRFISKAVHVHEFKHLSELQKHTFPHETAFVTGCLMYISKECLESVGLLNETLFMYCEDLDYCIRAKKMGYSLYHVPSIVIWHKFSASTGGELSTFSAYWIIRNRILIARWHSGFLQQVVTVVYFLVTRIPRFVKWYNNGHSGVIKAQLRGFRDGLFQSHTTPIKHS